MKKKPSKKKKPSINKNLISIKKPNLIIEILNLKCKVAVNDDIYTPKEKKEIQKILDILSKEICIDKTYVDFKRNRWKDAFINEKMWYEFCKLVIETDFGKNCSKKDNDEITNCLLIIALTYLYSALEKYDYDVEDIDIYFVKNSKFKCIYELDGRTSWNF